MRLPPTVTSDVIAMTIYSGPVDAQSVRIATGLQANVIIIIVDV